MVGASIRLEFEGTLSRMEIRKQLPFNANHSAMLSLPFRFLLLLSFPLFLFLSLALPSLSLSLSLFLSLSRRSRIRVYSSSSALYSLHDDNKMPALAVLLFFFAGLRGGNFHDGGTP